jgi:hypothetical protein
MRNSGRRAFLKKISLLMAGGRPALGDYVLDSEDIQAPQMEPNEEVHNQVRGCNSRAKNIGSTLMEDVFGSPLDAGIERAVIALRAAEVETFESCEGGPGHAYTEPTVRFHGQQPEGFRTLSVAMSAGLSVAGLRRV